jgi:hypothetical protein
MARNKEETSRFRTDTKKYLDNYTHIFCKDICECEECEKLREDKDINAKLARSCTEQ